MCYKGVVVSPSYLIFLGYINANLKISPYVCAHIKNSTLKISHF